MFRARSRTWIHALGVLGVGAVGCSAPLSGLVGRDRRRSVAFADVEGGAVRSSDMAAALAVASVEEDVTLTNWSATHEICTRHMYQPESMAELVATVKACHRDGTKLRPLGSGLSPNAIAFDEGGVLSMALLDEVLDVDTQKKTVRVQAGAKISQLVDALRPHGLSLANYASIAEQQVSAHGSGAAIPPLDETVLSFRIVTPAFGEIELSAEEHPTLFRIARVGLGALGILADVTFQCVPAHLLREKTFVTTPQQIRLHHKEWLREHQHLRYMWIPYTDSVVVVWSDPASLEDQVGTETIFGNDEALEVPRTLLRSVRPDLSEEEVRLLSFMEIRDHLIHRDPLNTEHIRKVNEAEAEFWKKKEGVRIDWSDKILGFDCGGQQWVSEVAFPSGTETKPSEADLDFMDDIREIIERERIPAPAPIEQRWTSASSSFMSPAWHPQRDAIFSWVGIIMYLPPAGGSTQEDEQRKDITNAFLSYKSLMEDTLWDRYSAMEHWAKIETNVDSRLEMQRKRLERRVPMKMFEDVRKEMDPKGILSNDAIHRLFSSAPKVAA